MLLGLSRSHAPYHFLVKDGDRGDTTRAYAARNQERNALVWCCSAGLDPGAVFDCLQNLGATFDVTSRAQANDAAMLALWFQAEQVIEGCYPVYFAERQFQAAGDKVQRRVIEVTERLLYAVQGLD